ncbi:MAG TPA: hypothetical protein VFG64_11470 [Dongiaceae bacterium]|nr:hypothetical protein [Dongiaceae bacterium]
MQNLERGRADLAGPHIEMLLTAAPGHETTQRLNAMRHVIACEQTASRSAASLGPPRAIAQDKVDLVAFHVDLPAAPSGIHERIDYKDALRLSFQSAAQRAPRARRVVLTDEATDFPDTVGADAIVRFAMDPRLTMFERTRAQAAYLRSMADDRACVLMDTDVAINRDPVEALQTGFDVGLTWRTGFADAPFNGGLILVADACRGRAFMARVLDCYEGLAADARLSRLFSRNLKSWWGDQFALAIVIGYRAFAERAGEAMLLDGTKIGFLPCANYNFTLEPGRNYDRAELRQKYFIHFKGNRKGMLGQYVKLMMANAL